VLQHLLVVLREIVRVLQDLVVGTDGVALECACQLLGERRLRLLLRLLALVRKTDCRLARHLEGGRKQLDKLVELGEARLEVGVARHLELHADAEAVHTVRVVHRTHRQQVLEELARLAVVGDLHVAIDAAAKRVLNDGDGLWLRPWALQEAAVATLSLGALVPGDAAELVVDEEHRVARHGHV